MNNTPRIAYFLIALLFMLFGCKEKKTKEEIDFEQRKAKRESLKYDLTKKYGIGHSWDTLRFSYSIQFQEIAGESNHLITYFDVLDVFQENDNKYLFVEAMIIPRIYLKLLINDKLYQKVKSELVEERFHRGFIVVKIRNIRKLVFESRAEVEGEDIYLEHEPTNDFIGSGEVVDIVIL